MRRLVVPSLVAALLSVAYGWAQLVGYVWTDYEAANEVQFRALVHGDFATFFQMASIEAPSMLLRAPFAFGSWIWGASDMAIYRMVSVPGLLAGAVLAVVLFALRERLQPKAGWGLAVVLLAAGNPVTLRALELSHPEELLGAALCIGAVLAALWQRPYLAAILLGLAMANKAWAVLAIGPVLLALEQCRWRVLTIAGAIGAVFVLPFFFAGDGARTAVMTAGNTYGVFQPWQIWWPLGETGHVIRGMDGLAKADFRAAPTWLAPLAHPLIAFLVVPASLLWRRRRGVQAATPDIFLLLATLFLARCVLDPANNVYYHLPFVLTLLTWEALQRARPPILATVAVCLIWLTFQVAPGRLSPDAQWAVYVVWAVPALVALAYATFRVPLPSVLTRVRERVGARLARMPAGPAGAEPAS